GVAKLVLGLSGWAQVNGRNELPIPAKVAFDVEYLQNMSFLFDLRADIGDDYGQSHPAQECKPLEWNYSIFKEIAMGNLIDIQSQIEKLQKQATEIKTREYAKTISEIVATMQAFGISVKDLQTAMARRGAPRKARGKAAVASAPGKRAGSRSGARVAPKNRGPNGETWTGRGLTPRWLAGLLAQGKSKEEFVIGQ
ncbi:MAG: H-NS histone family protein, partial [Rhodoferax sp.]|nr:H-NS histone family protein [Rhodoferax sp.]